MQDMLHVIDVTYIVERYLAHCWIRI